MTPGNKPETQDQAPAALGVCWRGEDFARACTLTLLDDESSVVCPK